MIIDGFLGNRLYSVTLDEDEYALFSELEEQREFTSKATKLLRRNLLKKAGVNVKNPYVLNDLRETAADAAKKEIIGTKYPNLFLEGHEDVTANLRNVNRSINYKAAVKEGDIASDLQKFKKIMKEHYKQRHGLSSKS